MTDTPSTPNARFGRRNIALLAAIAVASIAAVAGFRAVFADWTFMVAAVVAGVGAAAIVGFAWMRRLLIGETIAVAAVGLVVVGTVATNGLPTPDAFRTFFDGLINGWADILSQTPPLDVTPERMVLPFSLAWISAVIGGELVRRTSAPVLSTIGPLTALAVSVLVTAEDRSVGIAQGVIIGLVALAVGFAQSRTAAVRDRSRTSTGSVDDEGLAIDDLSTSRSRRRLLRAGATLTLIAIVAPFVGPRLPFASAHERFDLRDRNDPPWDPLAISSPLVQIKPALREDVKEDVVFTVRSDDPIERFDLAVLGAYNGVVWTVGSTDAADPRLEFRAVGSKLPASPVDLTAEIDEQTATITVGTLTGPWLPTAGWPTGIDFGDDRPGRDIRMNLVTGTLAIPAGVTEGLTYDLDVDVERRPTDASLADLTVEQLAPIDDETVVIPAAIRNLAADILEGVDPGWDQLMALQRRFIDDGFYDVSVESPPGHSYFRLAQFLAEPDRLVGFEEQYAAAAATISELARLPTRVVVGYVVEPSRYDSDGVAEVLANDISAWIEVDFGSSGWIPVDVTPDRSREPQAEAVGKTIEDVAVPSPPPPPQIPPDPEVLANEEEPEEAEDEEEDDEDEDDDAAAQPAGISPVRIAGFAGGGLAALALLAVALIVGWKARRRSRRRQASLPADSIGWAWRETLDRYDEAGLALAPTTTPQEAARALQATESTAAAAHEQLRSMVAIVQRSAYHAEPPDSAAGTRAWAYYDEVSDALRRERSLFERAKMLVTPRTLRRRGWQFPLTTSPTAADETP